MYKIAGAKVANGSILHFPQVIKQHCQLHLEDIHSFLKKTGERTMNSMKFFRRLFCAPFCCLFPCMRVPPEKVGIRLELDEEGTYSGQRVSGLSLVDRSKETLHLVDPQVRG